jgi:cell fate regulator YaaT (PSP1 superfamily)
MELPSGQKPFPIVEVQFKNTRKAFYRNVDNLPLKEGDIVAVESQPGHDVGMVTLTGELVRLRLRKKGLQENDPEIKNIFRLARPADIEKWEAVKALEHDTMIKARQIAASLNLTMKLSDVEYQGDGKKAIFYYTAEGRVDFRELIKKLAEAFKIRVEMKQIGLRQEAGRLGGIGSCGRELCCSTWLTEFKNVTTSAARYQNLSINPAKIAGQCGKLKCCLNYELDTYLDALKDIPEPLPLYTRKGKAVHQKTDIFKKRMWYAYVDPETNTTGPTDTWIALSAQQVKEIIEMNQQNQQPADLAQWALDDEEDEPGYADVVGQDSLTRLDKKKKRKKKKHRDNPSGQTPMT